MKKITLAALLLATAGIASAQVEISGKIGMYMDRTEKGGAQTTGVVQEGTNNITFKAKEDLGGGLSARVIVDTKLTTADPTSANTQLGDRESTVGLASAFGSVDMGRSYSSSFNVIRTTDPFGNMYASIAPDIHPDHGKRFSNGVFLKATPIAGAQVSYDRVQSTTAGAVEGLSYGLNYSIANVQLKAARFEQGLEKSNIFGAVATLSTTRLSVIHSDDTSSTGVLTHGTSVGVAQPITGTKVTMLGSYGKKTGNSSTDATAYNVGMNYDFSKRTSGQLMYRKVDANVASLDTRQVGVGLIHRF